MKFSKKLTTLGILSMILVGNSFSVSADSDHSLRGGTMAVRQQVGSRGGATIQANQGKNLTLPSNQGVLTANVWRSQTAKISGNTYQWDYQVSAVYKGSKTVEKIRTTWNASASLRNSANINLGISDSGASVGGGSSWRGTTTKTKYWENSNGAKVADYRSNVIVSPRKDYRTGTISVSNTAKVKLKGNPKSYEISAGA